MSEISRKPYIPRVPFRGEGARRAIGHLMRGEVPMLRFDEYAMKDLLQQNPVEIQENPRRRAQATAPAEVLSRLQKHAEYLSWILGCAPDSEGKRHAFRPGQAGMVVARFPSAEDNDRYPADFDDIPASPDYEVRAGSPVLALRAMLHGTARVRVRRLSDTEQTDRTWSDIRTLPVGAVSLHVSQGTPNLDPTVHWHEAVGEGQQVYFEQLLVGGEPLDTIAGER